MIQELSNGGKHYMALKKAVEMTTQKKVESCRLTKSWVTFVFRGWKHPRNIYERFQFI